MNLSEVQLRWQYFRDALQLDRAIGRLREAQDLLRRRRVAPRVDPEGAGPLTPLIESFNEVSTLLTLDRAVCRSVRKLDRSILTGADFDAVLRTAVKGLRAIAPCEAVAVTLAGAPGRGRMNVFAMHFPEGQVAIKRGVVPFDEESRPGLPAAPVADARVPLPLPERLQRWMISDRGCTNFTVLPVHGTSGRSGVVVLGHKSRVEIGGEVLRWACDIADRIEIAFESVERTQRLSRLADTDALTGLLNRNALLVPLQGALGRANAQGTLVGVLFIDLDRFKRVNDTMGHAAGDALLREASDRIRASVRDHDIVARQGGDEFIVVLGDLRSADDAGNIARELVRSLSLPFTIEEKLVYVGASAGIAIFPEHGAEPEDLLKKADTAMYRAKEHGRGRVALFDESMLDDLQRRANPDRDLRGAIERSEFVLHYQPQFELATGHIYCVEALIRWQHPERGLILPGQFIGLVEESGLVDPIGAWVIEEACWQFRRWREEGVPIPRVAVNVSIKQMRRSGFVRAVETALARAGMQPELLEVEVTESMFLQGDKVAQAAIEALVRMGVRLAIDDFGTGYSSYSYLRSVPASVLKLDRSFIRDSARDSEAAAVVAAMVSMARILGKEVVAEGVDSADQIDLLRSLGCERVQGFHFSRAIPPDEMARFALGTNQIEDFVGDAHPASV